MRKPVPQPFGSLAARHGPSRRGFTLLEAALATIIIGVGVLAVVEAQMSFLARNSWSTNGSTATYLANEIREMVKRLPRHDRFSGGLYFVNDADPTSFQGWGPEIDENDPLDLDDLDDFDGAVFGSAAEFPDGFTMSSRYEGPVNAFGQVIAHTLYDGSTMMLAEDPGDAPEPVALRGWTQLVEVQKVDPEDYAEPVDDNEDVREGNVIVRRVDRYPVRVTVTVLWQEEPEDDPRVMTRMSWVAMP